MKRTTAAIAAVAVDLTALAAAVTLESAELGCEVTYSASACVNRLSAKGLRACLHAGDRIEGWRLHRKDQLRRWAETADATSMDTSLDAASHDAQTA